MTNTKKKKFRDVQPLWGEGGVVDPNKCKHRAPDSFGIPEIGALLWCSKCGSVCVVSYNEPHGWEVPTWAIRNVRVTDPERDKWRLRWPAKLSVRTERALLDIGVDVPEDLLDVLPSTVARQKNVGKATMREVFQIIQDEYYRKLEHWRDWFRERGEKA